MARRNIVRKSLNIPRVYAGAERGFAIVNGAGAGALVFMLHLWWWIPIAIGIHMFLVWMQRRDPVARKVYIRYKDQAQHYDPWPHAVASLRDLNARPKQMGRGLLC